MYWYRILLVCWGIWFANIGIAQELTTRVYDIDSPLKSNTINEIYYAKDGLLYIAAQSGFFSYNGHNFKEFKLPNDVSFNGTNIQEDRDGSIYLLNSFDRFLYKLEQDTIKEVLLPDSVARQKLIRFIIDGSFHYCIFSHSILILNQEDSTHTTIRGITAAASNISQNGVIGVAVTDGDNKLVQLQDGKVVDLNRTTYRTRFHRQLDSSIVDYVPEEAGNGWIKDWNGDTVINLNNYPEKITPGFVKSFRNYLLVGCEQGLYIPQLNRLYMKGQFITGLFEDSENSIWIATLDAGLHRVDLNYLHYPIDKKEGGAHFVFAHKDRMLYSDRKGNIYTWDDTEQKTTLIHKSRVKATVKNIFYNAVDECYGISGNEYRVLDATTLKEKSYFELYGACAYDDTRDKIDYTVFKAGYRTFSPQLLKDKKSPSKFAKETIVEFPYGVFLDNSGLIEDSIYLNKAVSFTGEKKSSNPVSWGEYVVGTYNSILVFVDLDKRVVVSAEEYEGINSFYESNDQLFVVTNKEILEINKQNKIINRVTREDGLKQTITNLTANDNYIAVSILRYVYLLESSTLQVVYRFSPQNGIVSKDASRGWLYDDYLYINGSAGVSKIDLRFPLYRGTPSLKIKQVTSNGKILLSNHLDYTQDNLKFTFDIRSLKIAGQLYWRLKGEEWIKTDGNEVKLSNLKYGAYTLEAYYENNLGVRSERITYNFLIAPPYWQTWWFQLALYGMGIVFLFGIGWTVVKNNQKKLAQENQFNQLKLQALQSQMNPHFIFNVLTAVQNLWLQGKNEAAMKLQSNFAKLLRKIFQYSSQQNITIEQLADFLNNYLKLEQIRFDNKVNIDFVIDKALYEEDYGIPPLLLQPVIENSFKHGLLHKEGNKELVIKLMVEGDYLYATITDNGVGRDMKKIAADTRKSGLKTTQQRLNILQESKFGKPHLHQNIRITDLKNESNIATGTKVEIWIPLTDFKQINYE